MYGNDVVYTAVLWHVRNHLCISFAGESVPYFFIVDSDYCSDKT